MNIQELNIGNWILWDNSWNNEPCKVVGINPPYIDLVDKNNNPIYSIDVFDIVPISITEERLDKIGFKKVKPVYSNKTYEIEYVDCKIIVYIFNEYSQVQILDNHNNGLILSRINYIHQLYSFRNAFVLSQLLKKVESYPQDIQSALKVFILSYNQSHSTLMTRVVAKKGNKDFVLTGAQSGVMYISSLPVEKNIIEGLKRKIKTFRDAIDLVHKSQSRVQFVNGSSINTILADNSIDYVFTDPPFGDYIPYSEINQINEIWYGEKTNSTDEVIINHNQKKGTNEYSSLMTSVFSEVYRCLKTKGLCTVVFHSAKAEIWRSIITAYQIAGLSILKTGILDKVQASFKQVNSSITVKGDPLLLLTKSAEIRQTNNIDDKIVAAKIIERHSHEANCKEKSEIMFSEFIGECIEQGITITLNANYFFKND